MDKIQQQLLIDTLRQFAKCASRLNEVWRDSNGVILQHEYPFQFDFETMDLLIYKWYQTNKTIINNDQI